MGERSKHLYSNEDVDKMLCDSAVIIQHLSTDHDIVYVAHYESCCNLKLNKYQVKSFNSDSTIEVIGDMHDFTIENIENSIYSNSSNHIHYHV